MLVDGPLGGEWAVRHGPIFVYGRLIGVGTVHCLCGWALWQHRGDQGLDLHGCVR